MSERADDGHFGQDAPVGATRRESDAIEFHVQAWSTDFGRQLLGVRATLVSARDLASRWWDRCVKDDYFDRVYIETRHVWGERMKIGTVAMFGGIGLPEGAKA